MSRGSRSSSGRRWAGPDRDARVEDDRALTAGADAERILKLVEVLEELDDVSKVFSNFDIDAAQLAEAET